MIKSLIKLVSLLAFLIVLCQETKAQLPGPGAKRDYDRIQELERGSILEKDTIVILDTIAVYDPETSVETVMVVQNKFSVYEYCQQVLGIANPNDLLDGQEMTITNPETYEPMKIRWNASAGKIDTIQ